MIGTADHRVTPAEGLAGFEMANLRPERTGCLSWCSFRKGVAPVMISGSESPAHRKFGGRKWSLSRSGLQSVSYEVGSIDPIWTFCGIGSSLSKELGTLRKQQEERSESDQPAPV